MALTRLGTNAITALPAGVGGKVLQVQQGILTSNFSTTSTSFVDTGLSVTITPSSASNKIIVLVNHPEIGVEHSGSQIHCYAQIKLLRNSTSIKLGTFGTYNYASSSNKSIYTSFSFSYLDNPSTTSAITYKTQCIANAAVSSNFYIYSSATQINSITAMEIA